MREPPESLQNLNWRSSLKQAHTSESFIVRASVCSCAWWTSISSTHFFTKAESASLQIRATLFGTFCVLPEEAAQQCHSRGRFGNRLAHIRKFAARIL